MGSAKIPQISKDNPAPADASQRSESGEATKPISFIKFRRGDLFTLLPVLLVWLLSEFLRYASIFPRMSGWFEIVFTDIDNN